MSDVCGGAGVVVCGVVGRAERVSDLAEFVGVVGAECDPVVDEPANVGSVDIGGVAGRVDGEHRDVDRFGVVAESVDGLADFGERGRAGIGTVREPEEHHEQTARVGADRERFVAGGCGLDGEVGDVAEWIRSYPTRVSSSSPPPPAGESQPRDAGRARRIDATFGRSSVEQVGEVVGDGAVLGEAHGGASVVAGRVAVGE